MTSEEFRKTSFRATTLIDYTGGSGGPITCLLLEVDFEQEILTIYPIDRLRSALESFQVNIKHCKIHDKKVKKLAPG